jgi:hypothetical protein
VRESCQRLNEQISSLKRKYGESRSSEAPHEETLTVQAQQDASERRAPRIGRLHEVGRDECAALPVAEHHLLLQPVPPKDGLLEVSGLPRLRLVSEHPVERSVPRLEQG